MSLMMMSLGGLIVHQCVPVLNPIGIILCIDFCLAESFVRE